MKGSPPLVHSKNKASVTALREIASGKVHYDRASHDAVQEYIEEIHKREFGG
jgi:DNA-directed RNA polymerase subunit omega